VQQLSSSTWRCHKTQDLLLSVSLTSSSQQREPSNLESPNGLLILSSLTLTVVIAFAAAFREFNAKPKRSLPPLSTPPPSSSSSSSDHGTPFEYSPSPGTHFRGTSETEIIRAKYVVNCAGVGADRVANMVLTPYPLPISAPDDSF
jgi:hypothetical protein